MKCGYLEYKEYTNPYHCVYGCRYFGFSAGTEKILCNGCTLDKKGIPHIPDLEKSLDYEEDDEDD